MSQAQAENSLYALEAKEVTAVLGGQKVMEIPSLRVNSNEVLMVIGPNGSGKTTLLLCLALLLKPATGTISYKGIPVTSSEQILKLRRRLAVVFQEPLLLNSTVWDNVTLGMRLRGVTGDESRVRAEKWLERFGISQLAKRQARTLSSGEAKRVSLARAFVLQPEVLFLDEPFNALDSPTRQSLLDEFESVLRETRVTTVMVTHDRNEALMLADRVAVIINGSIGQLGTPEEVFGSPVDEEVARFVGVENIIDGVVTACKDSLVTINASKNVIEAISDCSIGERVHASIRPEDVTIALSRLSSSARNSFAGEIMRTVSAGALTRLEMDCGFPLVALVTRRSAEEMGLVEGKQVYASFKATAIHVMKRGS
ncbi:MAG: ABC transporter ATP-binding protein [Chloroflexota bacterium]